MKYILACWLALLALGTARAQQFKVSYAPAAYAGPFTGNVILYFSQKNAQPKDHAGWPCYRLAVQNVRPGQAITFTDAAISYPTLHPYRVVHLQCHGDQTPSRSEVEKGIRYQAGAVPATVRATSGWAPHATASLSYLLDGQGSGKAAHPAAQARRPARASIGSALAEDGRRTEATCPTQP